ncbi:MAG: hypothetical protein FWF26_04930, partial [Treponema sp.]|nr:hypothetical protein [Treponema sp.]
TQGSIWQRKGNFGKIRYLILRVKLQVRTVWYTYTTEPADKHWMNQKGKELSIDYFNNLITLMILPQ